MSNAMDFSGGSAEFGDLPDEHKAAVEQSVNLGVTIKDMIVEGNIGPAAACAALVANLAMLVQFCKKTQGEEAATTLLNRITFVLEGAIENG